MRNIRQSLLFVIAISVSLILMVWLSWPVWTSEGYEVVRFAGKNVERSELSSLGIINNQKECYMVVHDWRTGQLLRKLPLEVPEKEHCIYFLNVASEGDSQAPLLLTQTDSAQIRTSYLLDSTTGKRLQHAPIEEWCMNEKLARHQNQLALALKAGIRLFRDKTDFGRSVPIPNARKICFSPNGGSLVCVDDNGLLYRIEVQSGEVAKLVGCDMKAFDVSFLKNGELAVTSFKEGGGPISQLGIYFSRWKCEGTTLHQVHQTPLLRTEEEMSVPMPVHLMEDGAGSVQVDLYQGTAWPDATAPVLNWLQTKGYSVEKWIPKKWYQRCYVLNHMNQIESTRKKWFDEPFKLDEGFAVDYQPNWHEGKTIAVFSTRRIWPWSVAVGIIVYAVIWRITRRKMSIMQIDSKSQA